LDSNTINSASQARFTAERMAHWDANARRMDTWRGAGGTYHRRLQRVYRSIIAPGKRVLELGCARGDLLASLQPSQGVGVDFSPEMIRRARAAHPDMTFIEADILNLEALEGPFDAIILSDLVNDVWDVQTVLDQVHRLCTPSTRIVLNFFSRFWELPLKLAEKIGLSTPNLLQNWLSPGDVAGLLNLSGFEEISRQMEVLFPLPIPLINGLCDRYLVKIWPFRTLGWTTVMIARPVPAGAPADAPLVSVIVPARNESGNVPSIFERVPEMGAGTELIFVEGSSKDDTYSAIEREIAAHPERRCKLLRQTGRGKGDAVRLGYDHASGEVLMILDADLTMPPEDLPRFYNALVSGKGEFINGVRLVYPMEKEAMRFLNLLGNKFFSMTFSWLLGQHLKDTLCGTKVLWKADYLTIAANRSYFGDFDPFGDFDLLFGAARLRLKIVDLPIRYRERVYGTTNISRWSHGWLLLKMVMFAAQRIKFI
jgi:ubiquinone/menaquinone biosynthesis C-methylase UbiE